ncbi:glycosyltransferase family A protein [Streptomyces microflavus]|uniref:glycosyltransferase family 2 protein n=1 Tax=Streptomyces microflavus TaxID=1919 RepID=UPI0033B63856
MIPPLSEGLSFVIPCFNPGHYLREAVDSLRAQPHAFPYEVLIVDDRSDDSHTLHTLSACADLPGVRVRRLAARGGHHAARNVGLRHARFGYVMQLDADDRLATDPELLADGSFPDRAVEILRADPTVAFVHTMSRMFGDFDGLTISSCPCPEELVLRKHQVPTSIVHRHADALVGGLYEPRVVK